MHSSWWAGRTPGAGAQFLQPPLFGRGARGTACYAKVGVVCLERWTATGPEVVLHHGILSCLFVSLHSEFEFSPVASRNKFPELRETVIVPIQCMEHKVFSGGVCTNQWDKVPACFVAVVAA